MTECQQLDELVTPYVDGEISAADRERIDRHLRVCGPCRGRVRVERSVHALIHDHRAALLAEAPPALRARCASVARSSGSPFGGVWRARFGPLALAASLVVVVSGAFLYELTARSTRVMAAELTADHLKCFRVMNNVVRTDRDPEAVRSSIESRFDWPV